MSDEPATNIGGGKAVDGDDAQFSTGDPATRAEAVVDALGDRYWQTAYGGRDAFPCLVRTILSQNTSDVASQPAFDALLERYGDDGDLAVALAAADRETLAATIESAGLYNQKSRVIVDCATEICSEFGDAAAFDAFVREGDPGDVRERLLDMRGVGPKTADCVLLFAAGRDGVFPVDTHVHRVARRLGLAPADADHEVVRESLEPPVPASPDDTSSSAQSGVDGADGSVVAGGVPREKCGFGHTVMIQFGRDFCTARTPACLDDRKACPLENRCDRVGVDPERGEVVDPAATVD